MKAGQLRHQITLQEPVYTATNEGNRTVSWNDVATVWAEVRPVSGFERWSGDRREARITHRVRIRHRDGVNPQMRILFGSRTFAVHAALDPDERGIEQLLLCEETVTG